MGHKGTQTMLFKEAPVISCTYASVGPKEGEGPLKTYFDECSKDDLYGQDTWEKAESQLVKQTLQGLLTKSGKQPRDIQYIFCGDLLNQLGASSFGIKSFNIPFLGLYGACSTMGESLGLAAMTVSGGFADCVIAGASSHYCSSEKQFRFPLEYGSQRKQTQQWTVTGCGFGVVVRNGTGPKIKGFTPGKLVDFQIKDSMNMGAAMAPAAADTIVTFLNDTGESIESFDAIITGDLGIWGSEIVLELCEKMGKNIADKHLDCGKLIFDCKGQKVDAGGSGCGCSASVFSSYIYQKLIKKEWQKILLIPTGALMNALTVQQGQTIPGIAHVVWIQNE